MENENMVERSAPIVVDERNIPQALVAAINTADQQIIQTQQQLLNQLNEMALELMQLMQLPPSEGWTLDLSRKKFIKLQTQPLDNE